MFRRSAVLLLIAVLAAFGLSGCARSAQSNLAEGKVNVVTSFYTLYDFAVKIGGEHAHVINVVPSGVEPHDWTPKSRDMKNMSGAQLLLYNGIGLEGWIDDFLGSLNEASAPIVVEASRGVELIKHDESEEREGAEDHAGGGAHEEKEHADGEHADGHEDEHADGHDDEHADEKGGGHGHSHEDLEYDPHAWISPKQAMKYAENIKNGFVQADPAHQADYEANYARLLDQLDQLDRRFRQELGSAAKKEIIVSHEAFGYLCRDYGLTQMPIMGLAPDSEPTARELKAISDFAREHQVKYIFFEELVSDKLAKTLAGDLKIDTLVLNPLEGLTEEEVGKGSDYFSVMENNLQNLLKGLQ